MVRALLWKEWRRLRGLRWACVGIGLALPVGLFLAAQAAARGWGVAALSGYSSRNLLLELLPAVLALGLWPLAAMMMTVNAFTADRAEGTESFLLDRPVPRVRIWWARLAASLGSLAMVVLIGVGMVLSFLASEGGAGGVAAWRGALLAVVGAILVVAAVVAALGATSLVSAPLPALLLALLFAAFPLLAGAGGTMVFPYATWNRIPLATIAACLIGLGLPLASWLADARGEPSGRGRRLRAAIVLGGSLLFGTIAFACLAPMAVRAGARSGRFSVIAPAAGKSTVALNQSGGGFLLDLRSGQERVLLVPEVSSGEWDPAGSRVALLDESGPLGSVGPPRLRFLDASGREIWRPVRQHEDFPGVEIAWSGNRVVVLSATDSGGRRLSVVDPAEGRQTILVKNAPSAALHRTRDGRVFAALTEGGAGSELRTVRWSLHAVDVDHEVLGAAVLQERGPGYFAPGLSPTGRYWIGARAAEGKAIFEVGTGRRLPLPLPDHTWPTWVTDDEMIWLQNEGKGAWTLVAFRPGGETAARARGFARNPRLLVSPGRDHAMVLTPNLGFAGARLVDLAGRALPPLPPVQRGEVAWAGPHTLSISRTGRLELYDVLTAERKVVLGDQ